jgi:hypothetical protein
MGCRFEELSRLLWLNSGETHPKRIHASASRPAKPAPPEKAKPNLPKKHPNISVSIAERFSSDCPGWRLLSTYPDLQVKELKELLSERALPKTGRKDELVALLEEYDDQHPSTERKAGDDRKDALRRQPVPIGAVASEMGPKDEDLETRVVRGGPNGPPVYDEMGFELDYEKCARGSVMPSKKTMLNRMDRAIARHREEGAVKLRIMGMQGENLPLYVEWAWNDRVSRDLGIPYHKVGAEQFEEWERKGFRADPQDFENLGKEEEERLEFLTIGCALRKWPVWIGG